MMKHQLAHILISKIYKNPSEVLYAVYPKKNFQSEKRINFRKNKNKVPLLKKQFINMWMGWVNCGELKLRWYYLCSMEGVLKISKTIQIYYLYEIPSPSMKVQFFQWDFTNIKVSQLCHVIFRSKLRKKLVT
jgi:hypothetical protein